MRVNCVAVLALVTTLGFSSAAVADSYNFSFNGDGISASGVITVGQQSTNLSTPPGYEITGITGTFSDTNAGVSGAITGLYTPVSYVNDPLVAGFATTSGGLSYDDLFYPAGDSPTVCYELVGGVPTLTYPFSGGVFDIYGVAFNIAGPGGYVADLWSNGDVNFQPTIVYAAGLANATSLVDVPNPTPGAGIPPPGRYGTFTASPTPEPSSLVLLGFGLVGILAVGARKKGALLSPRE